jgi:hypothetical protein
LRPSFRSDLEFAFPPMNHREFLVNRVGWKAGGVAQAQAPQGRIEK